MTAHASGSRVSEPTKRNVAEIDTQRTVPRRHQRRFPGSPPAPDNSKPLDATAQTFFQIRPETDERARRAVLVFDHRGSLAQPAKPPRSSVADAITSPDRDRDDGARGEPARGKTNTIKVVTGGDSFKARERERARHLCAAGWYERRGLNSGALPFSGRNRLYVSASTCFKCLPPDVFPKLIPVKCVGFQKRTDKSLRRASERGLAGRFGAPWVSSCLAQWRVSMRDRASAS
jgi:hypothetical protein